MLQVARRGLVSIDPYELTLQPQDASAPKWGRDDSLEVLANATDSTWLPSFDGVTVVVNKQFSDPQHHVLGFEPHNAAHRA